MPPQRLYGLTDADLASLRRLAAMFYSEQRRHEAPRAGPRNQQWVKASGTTAVTSGDNSYYPGHWYAYNAATDAWVQQDAVWLRFANGVTVNTTDFHWAPQVDHATISASERGVFGVPAASGGGAGATAGTFQARLSLSPTDPVSVADQASVTTIYLHPYKGNIVTYRSGGTITTGTLSAAVTLNTSALAVDTLYDVFLYHSGANFTLAAEAWAAANTRSVSLTTAGGLKFHATQTDRLYVGTFRTAVFTGWCYDTAQQRFLWNYFNRVPRTVERNVTGSAHTYSSTAVRFWNNSNANKVEYVVGLREDASWWALTGGLRAISSTDDPNLFLYEDTSGTSTLGNSIFGLLRNQNTSLATVSGSGVWDATASTWVGYTAVKVMQSVTSGGGGYDSYSLHGLVWG